MPPSAYEFPLPAVMLPFLQPPFSPALLGDLCREPACPACVCPSQVCKRETAKQLGTLQWL